VANVGEEDTDNLNDVDLEELIDDIDFDEEDNTKNRGY
jgi:hypothetical protein